MPMTLRQCVPRTNGEYMSKILPKYEHVVRIDARHMDLISLHPIESWCEEYFGKLEEDTSDSQWQVSLDDGKIGKGRFVNILCFHFHNDVDAMAFKLAWS